MLSFLIRRQFCFESRIYRSDLESYRWYPANSTRMEPQNIASSARLDIDAYLGRFQGGPRSIVFWERVAVPWGYHRCLPEASPQHRTMYSFGRSMSLFVVNLDKPLPNSISLNDGSGNIISVSYPWLPSRCTTCNAWGHVAECERMIMGSVVVPVKSIASNVELQWRKSGKRETKFKNLGLLLHNSGATSPWSAYS